jgi:hypothetical protein
MLLTPSYNSKDGTLEFLENEKVICKLNYNDAVDFKNQLDSIFPCLDIQNNVKNHQYVKLTMDDLNEFKKYDDRTILGVNLDIKWWTRLEYVSGDIQLILDDGDYFVLEYPCNMDENFPESQVIDGLASSRQIRRCFDKDVLEFIKKHPDFKVQFCEQEVKRESLFDDNIETFYDFSTCGDTQKALLKRIFMHQISKH